MVMELQELNYVMITELRSDNKNCIMNGIALE